MTLIWNSVNPTPLRPVGVTTGVAVMPLATNVPPVPSKVVPVRISQVAPVTLVLERSSEKASVIVHPVPVTLKLSYTLANCPEPREVLFSFARPLTPSKSPLYQSGPTTGVPEGEGVAVGVGVGEPVDVAVGDGEGDGVPQPPRV